MEKTLIQCRVINLKWLVTKTAAPFTRTIRRLPENKTKVVTGEGVRGWWDKRVFCMCVAM